VVVMLIMLVVQTSFITSMETVVVWVVAGKNLFLPLKRFKPTETWFKPTCTWKCSSH